MPGRKYEAQSGYRYGFNGKEKDKDLNSLTAYDYGFRIYNPGIGKFLSVDPLAKSYPWNSSYAFAENDIIRCVDLDGLEKVIAIISNDEKGNTSISMVIDKDDIRTYWTAYSSSTMLGNKKVVWLDKDGENMYKTYTGGASSGFPYPKLVIGDVGILTIDFRDKSNIYFNYSDWKNDHKRINEQTDERILDIVIDQSVTVASLLIGLGELKMAKTLSERIMSSASVLSDLDDLTKASEGLDNELLKRLIDRTKAALDLVNTIKGAKDVDGNESNWKSLEKIFSISKDGIGVIDQIKKEFQDYKDEDERKRILNNKIKNKAPTKTETNGSQE